MFYSYPQETMQEVPGEISLALSISGCPLRCKGCHSTETYDECYGIKLTNDELERLLRKHKHASCVLFYGGEWKAERLKELFKIIRKYGLKIALYSGYSLHTFEDDFLHDLDFIKTGVYQPHLGGLGSSTTNQKFHTISNGIFIDLTHTF
jgi:anaerobic ribonucleoside-triphosphate reductase activating protein